MEIAPEDVADFWFGAEGSPERGRARAVWFRKDPAFDASIRARFGAAVEAALAGGCEAWDATPHGALARIVLLDQFTRNIFRDTPCAFAGDARALAAADAAVARGFDPSEIQVGLHGIHISKDGRHGLLLPQVASELGWDRETFLRQVCAKAGLPQDAWRRGADIQVFTVERIEDGLPVGMDDP